MTEPVIEVLRLPHAEGLPLPAYATAGAAGMDLLAAVTAPVAIPPGGRALIPTGLRMALPDVGRLGGATQHDDTGVAAEVGLGGRGMLLLQLAQHGVGQRFPALQQQHGQRAPE